MARCLADDHRLSVAVVDTHGDLTGDGAEPHPCIGSARRVAVPEPSRQAGLLLQVLHNEAPQVVVIDEVAGPEVSDWGKEGGALGMKLRSRRG